MAYPRVNMQLRSKYLMPTLLLLVILPMISTDIYLPAMSSIGIQFGVVESNLTNTLTSYMFGYSVSLLFSGVLADIYGRRFISIVGLAIFFASSVGCFLASSVEGLMLWRFFQALGGGCGTLIARIIVRDIYDQQSQVRVLSYLSTGLVFSPIIGPILGAYVSSYFGWRSIFFVLACFSVFGLILLCVFMKESLVRHEPKKIFQFSSVLSEYFGIWRNREFVFNTLVISFAWAVYFTFLSSSPVLIQGVDQVGPIEYGYIFSTTISGFILGTIFIRWKIATINLKGLIAFAGFIIFIATLMLCITVLTGIESQNTKLFFVFCALFGVGIIFPATQAGVTKPFKNNIGLISGVFYSTEMFFGAICGFILSYLGGVTWGSAALMMLISATCIVLISSLDRLCSQDDRRIRFSALLKQKS